MRNKIFTMISAVILILSFSTSANATPSFASKYEKKCSYCHNAWPQLNAKGRSFRERGYRFKEDLKGKSPAFLESGSFPISALIQSRPYDKKQSAERQMRAIQEIELFIGGAINHNVSGFFEVEAEDDENNFEVRLANMAMSYRINDLVNLHATYAPTFWADSYGFMGNQFKLTRSKVGYIDQAFAGVNGKPRDRRQNFELSGRANKFFYIAGISGEAGDSQGVKSDAINARIAYDISNSFMIGAFTGSGTTKANPLIATSIDQDFTRTGFDFQADIGNSRIQAAYIMAEDDLTATSTEKNNAYSVQYIYHVKTATGSPTFVPVVRLDNYEKADGKDSYDEVTLNLTYYINENFKSFIEYWEQISVPNSIVADNRTTLQFTVGF
ncbi:MAG: hypothetical protein ACC657_13070 [Thiohalomonadales bacterium]